MGGSDSGVVRLRPGIEWRNIADEVVALDLESSAYLSVNDTGSVLWPLVASGTTEERLAEELMARFGLDHEHAHRDVAAFVEQLRSFSLMEAPA